MRTRAGALGAVAAIALALGLAGAGPASAAYEQVGTFSGNPGELQSSNGTAVEVSARWPEAVQLSGAGGVAVNHTGAGGVAAGTIYAVTQYETPSAFEGTRIARFDPDGTFSENWTFLGNPPNERCGPDGDPAHPVCQSRSGSGTPSIDVEVDQSSGYVYAFNGSGLSPGANQIHVYSPDGSKLIAEFGQQAAAGETIASSPEKTHETSFHGNIAIVSGGKVFVYDEDNTGSHRLMAFEPQSAGDYEHYVYAGQGKDVAAGKATLRARAPTADAAGDIYVVAGTNNLIAKLDPGQPAAAPICEFAFPKGHIDALTVNPQTGEPFFYTDTDKKIHQLSACKEGKFAEASSFGFEPKRFELTALVLDPTAQLGPGRPPGVLYGAAPSGEGGKTKAGPPIEVESALGYVFAAPAELQPEVLAESVEHVSATTAGLRAQINPKGPPTSFAFQYIAEAQYEANEPADRFAGAKESPPGGAPLGEGPKALAAATTLSGLAPDTTYHYRAIATSHCSAEDEAKVCEAVGAEQVFHTFPTEAPGLPDERAWELVSPALKGSGQVLPADPTISGCGAEAVCKPGYGYTHFPLQSAPDGAKVVYEGTPFSSGEGTASENQYIARRDPKAGWQSTNLTPSLLNKEGRGYRAFDSALSQGLLGQSTPALNPAGPADYANFYTQPTANPSMFGPLLTSEPPNRPPSGEGRLQLTYAGASADLSRIFFAANDALTAETPFAPEAKDGGPAKDNLYEWSAGQLRLINVLPGNAETEPGASFATATANANANAISKDGSHAFFSDEAGQLYLRIDGAETQKIEDPGKFLSASTDGSKVLLDDGCLYDLAEERCEDLSQGQGGFQGIAGQSDDLSHVYFLDTASLAPGTEARSCQSPPEGSPQRKEEAEGKVPPGYGCNLYAWQEGTTRFVAALLLADNSGTTITRSKSWSASPSSRTAEASPGGRYLAFLSQAQISGYDNAGPCESDHAGGLVQAPCSEAFLYDSATGELRCASCNPSGTRPLGWSVLRLINGGTTSLPQPRYLTDQGRLYFDSRDSLTPFDTNNGAEDVYQYEPEGIGSCKREAGCVSLISAGSEAIDSNFLAIDEDGSNVFFTTRDRLVQRDEDDLIDLYDARVGGGIPSETEVARGECQGEACQAAAVPPDRPTPATSALAGDGNVEEKKASKKHRHGRAHAKKHKGHKRHSKKHGRGGKK